MFSPFPARYSRIRLARRPIAEEQDAIVCDLQLGALCLVRLATLINCHRAHADQAARIGKALDLLQLFTRIDVNHILAVCHTRQ